MFGVVIGKVAIFGNVYAGLDGLTTRFDIHMNTASQEDEDTLEELMSIVVMSRGTGFVVKRGETVTYRFPAVPPDVFELFVDCLELFHDNVSIHALDP